jgi:hypothetical protein
MYGGDGAALAALCEARALRANDHKASARRVRRFARIAAPAPPLGLTRATRALAYLAEHEGNAHEALRLLEQAEKDATSLEQRVDAAVARYQRGLRIGGDAGDALVRSARQQVMAAGGGAHLLDE